MLPYRATKISEHVWWVGAVDWNMRDFHGYSTNRGTTYNAYLVMGEKITLIDTVKAPFCGELLGRIASVVDPAEISYIVSNHAEMDHSGGPARPSSTPCGPRRSSPRSSARRPSASTSTLPMPVTPVKDGEQLSTSGTSRSPSPRRGWCTGPTAWSPGCPATTCSSRRTASACTSPRSERFADEMDPSVVEFEGGRTSRTSCCRSRRWSRRCIARLPELGIAPKVIAPDHGPVWRQDLGPAPRLVRRVDRASRRRRKALVVYDTMWDSTALMAHAVADGLDAGGREREADVAEGQPPQRHRARTARRRRAARGLADAEQQPLPRWRTS